jgi:hypothetical protein
MVNQMNHIFVKFSGWDNLVQKYGTAIVPVGTKFTSQTIKVGPVRYRWCVTAVLSPQGIYLNIGRGLISFGKLTPVLIPWSEFKAKTKGWLYLGWPAIEIPIGDPKIAVITFPLRLYKHMTMYLDR